MQHPRLMLAAALCAAITLSGPVSAHAAPAATTTYKNCTAVHKDYSGGIAKSGVTVNTIHHSNGTTTTEALKGTVKTSTSLYNANKKLDADNDGIACEKN